ncbi:MAG: serine hydrolase domain-containing protein, partial [Gemmatimonadota bacterium]
PVTFPEPITLRRIMTHSAGFEEDSRDLVSDDPARAQGLKQWLETHMPKRVRAPGTYTSYSNYSTALAGYAVERVSGEPWAEYIERHILSPLGMAHTTGVQPLPSALAGDMSVGYRFVDGEYQPKKFEILIGGIPAGAISTTAADMAKFMVAHLANGAYPGGRILGDSISRVMQTQAMTHDPRIPGFALGFYEQSSHGPRVFGHGGDTQWFHTNLALVPSEGLGIFVTFNTDQGGALTESFTRLVLDHYFPAPVPVPPTVPDAKVQAERVAGEYLSNRHSYTTYQKGFTLATGAWEISPGKEGAIVLSSGGETSRWLPVGALLYREELGNGLLAFKADESGRVIRAFLGDNPTDANERLAWYESPTLHKKLLGGAIAVFVLTLIAGVGRWIRGRLGRLRPAEELPGRGWLYAMVLANLGFIVAVGSMASDPTALLFGKPTGLMRALALPVLGALFALVALGMAVRQWRQRAGTVDARLRYAAVVIVGLVFAWSLNQWNLLGWRT